MSTVRTLSPEFDFLCLIARPRPDWDAARAALQTGLDGDELYRLAAQHAVRPQLVTALGRLQWPGATAELRAECDVFQRYHLARMLFLSDELRRVDALFAAHGIRLVAFKGAVLAAYLYGDLSQREYGDLDVIVPRHQVGEAERLLGSLGYSGPQRDAEFRHTFLAFQQQYAFIRDDIGVSIDLHWHFNGVHSPFPLQPADVWNDTAEVKLGDRQIATLSGVNLALLLAGHGTKEAWKKLGWIRDFAMLVDRHSDLDWPVIFGRAKAQRCGNAVLLGCLLAEILLGVPVPVALAENISSNRPVRERAVAMADALRRTVPPPQVRPYLEDLGLCDRRIDRIWSVVLQSLTRTAGDYAALPLRPPFWWIYYLTRPLRLVFKAIALFQRQEA